MDVESCIELGEEIPCYGLEEMPFNDIKWDIIGRVGSTTWSDHKKSTFLRADSITIKLLNEEVEIFKVIPL